MAESMYHRYNLVFVPSTSREHHHQWIYKLQQVSFSAYLHNQSSPIANYILYDDVLWRCPYPFSVGHFIGDAISISIASSVHYWTCPWCAIFPFHNQCPLIEWFVRPTHCLPNGWAYVHVLPRLDLVIISDGPDSIVSWLHDEGSLQSDVYLQSVL